MAEILFVSESNVAQIVKRLEKNGYIVRETDMKNKSRKILNLTNDGRLLLFLLLKLIFEFEGKFFENYTKEEVKKFKKMLYDYSEMAIKANDI